MIFGAAVHILPVIETAVQIKPAVRHDMRLAVRDMDLQRQNRISRVQIFLHDFPFRCGITECGRITMNAQRRMYFQEVIVVIYSERSAG